MGHDSDDKLHMMLENQDCQLQLYMQYGVFSVTHDDERIYINVDFEQTFAYFQGFVAACKRVKEQQNG